MRRNIPTSTRVRVVYDSSAKSGKRGVSLNECLHVGPSLDPLLIYVWLRFRIYKITMVADIEKAFLNIEIDSDDRVCLRFLWPEEPRKTDCSSGIPVLKSSVWFEFFTDFAKWEVPSEEVPED